MDLTHLSIEGKLPAEAKPRVVGKDELLTPGTVAEANLQVDPYSETNIAHRLSAETGEDVHVMIRNGSCLVTGRVQAENIDKIRSLLDGMGIAVTDQPA
jgi:hypothetical protein